MEKIDIKLTALCKYDIIKMSLVSCTELLLRFFLLLEGCAKPPDKYVEAYEMFAKYNGGKDSLYVCTEPDKLEIGHIYEVISANDKGEQLDYALKGVVGQFNSVWFDKVNVYTAITRNQPAVGHSMNCIKVEYFDGKYKTTPWTTSMVVKSEEIAEGVFKVITTNNVYMTMLVR